MPSYLNKGPVGMFIEAKSLNKSGENSAVNFMMYKLKFVLDRCPAHRVEARFGDGYITD